MAQVDPGQGEIIVTASFGTGFSVEARGVDRPVEWARASLTEVLLYVPYQITVVPAED